MQGFLFSRPVDADATTRLLRDFRPSARQRSGAAASAA